MKTTVWTIWAARVTFVIAGLTAPVALVLGQPQWAQAAVLVSVMLWSAVASSYAAQTATWHQRWKDGHLEWVAGYIAALNDVSAPFEPPDSSRLP